MNLFESNIPFNVFWLSTANLRPYSVVLLTGDEADAHDAAPGGVDAVRAAEPEWAATVDARLRRARREYGLPGDVSW